MRDSSVFIKHSDDGASRIFVGLVGSFIAGGLIWWMQSRLSAERFGLGDLFDPEVTSEIAASLPQDRDSFIYSALDFVSSEVVYEPVGSDIDIIGDTISCRRCLLPATTLSRMRGNCVAKSALLVSILRHRLPPDDVYMAVGSLEGIGGHAWVTVRNNGGWQVLESTKPASFSLNGINILQSYVPEVFLNDQTVSCYSDKICVGAHNDTSCDCML